MDGTGDDNFPVEKLSDLYDELFESGIVDGNVAVISDDTGWCISAHRNGAVIFEHLRDGGERHISSVPKARVIDLWNRLISGDIDGLFAEPWVPGY